MARARSDDEVVRIVPYDDAWPARFEQERALLERLLAPWLTGGVHHVGSTAVPGLAAKPVIDILAGVRDLPSSQASLSALAGAGYRYAPYREDVMHWLCKPDPSRRTHHLHLVPTCSSRYRDELAFRDALRDDTELAARYATLKHELAARHRHDRDAYTRAKADFIAAALAAAR